MRRHARPATLMTDPTSSTTRHRQMSTPGPGVPEVRARGTHADSLSQSLAPQQDGADRRTPTSAGKVRLFICRGCETTKLVQWCGEHIGCGHSGCVDALEECAAAHREPLDPKRFHGLVTLMQIDKALYEATAEER